MDATSVRNSFINSQPQSLGSECLQVHKVIAGEYPTQGGHFDIEIGKILLRVCVWTTNVVEIESMNVKSGETKEIQTLENTNELESANAINDHIRKYT